MKQILKELIRREGKRVLLAPDLLVGELMKRGGNGTEVMSLGLILTSCPSLARFLQQDWVSEAETNALIHAISKRSGLQPQAIFCTLCDLMEAVEVQGAWQGCFRMYESETATEFRAVFPEETNFRVLLESDSVETGVPVIEVNSGEPFSSSEEIAARYGLVGERYSRLLYAAFFAIAEGGYLQLVTELPLNRMPVVVEELSRCVREGLAPLLLPEFRFGKSKMPCLKVRAVGTGHQKGLGEALSFGVEDDRYTDITIQEEWMRQAFSSLATMKCEERERAVSSMRKWLKEASCEEISSNLICAAFYITSGMTPDLSTAFELLKECSRAGEKTPELSDHLIRLLLDGYGMDSEKGRGRLFLLAARCLKDSSLRTDPVGDAVCLALAETVFRRPLTNKIYGRLRDFLESIPENLKSFSDWPTKLIVWMLERNEVGFIPYGKDLMEQLSSANFIEFVRFILIDLDGVSLNDAQNAMLAEALFYTVKNRLDIGETYGTKLDAHCAAYTEELRDAALEYLFRVRFPAIGEKASLALLLNLEKKYPAYAGLVIKVLESGENPLLWENYRTKKLFAGGLNPGNIFKLMRDYNTFDNPMGPMEQRAMEIWLQLAREEFSGLAAELSDVFLKDYSELFAARWYDGTKKLNASDELKERITAELVDLFWETVTPEMIYANKEMIDRALLIPSEKHEIKMTLFAACLQVRKQGNQKSCRDFVDKITNPETKPEMREALQECAGKMFYAMIREKKDILWDLLLCRCWRVTEKDSGPDLKEFVELCRKLDEKLEELKEEKGKELDVTFDETASILLEDEVLKKAVCKLDGKSFVLDALIDAIKP